MNGFVDLNWDTADGERLRRTIARQGLTGRAFAIRIGVDKNTVSAWMHGRGNPTVKALRRMGSELGVPVCDLLQDAVAPTAAPPEGAAGPAAPEEAAAALDRLERARADLAGGRAAAEEAAAVLDRLERARADLAGVSGLLADLDRARSAAQALRRAFGSA